MIKIFVPSYNRAAQLRLLLDSLNRNMPKHVMCVEVFWKADGEFRQGYEKLIQDGYLNFPNITLAWREENNILGQFYSFLIENHDDIVGFFMDDCIMYRKLTSCPSSVFCTDDLWCFSLRLGLNTVLHDYLGSEEMEPVKVIENEGEYVSYDMMQYSPLQNYGFCFSWDGCFYKAVDLLRFFNASKFDTDVTNPNSILFQRIENYTQNRRDKLTLKPKFIIPKQSMVCCLNTSTTHAGSAGGRKFNYSLKEMNDRYLAGQVIDFDKLDFSNVRSCHIEIPMEWKNA